MRRIALLIFLLFMTINVFPQKENNIWYLGTFLGMNFNTGSMVPNSVGVNTMYAPRGCAAICHPKTGNLLFFTNGRNVYTRDGGKLMPNGSDITGVPMDANDVMIVPNPGDSMKYYVISVLNTASATSNPDCNLFYASVDMRANGGYGAVEYNKKYLANNVDHHFAVVKRHFDNGYWLITHLKGTSAFASFVIDKDSIHTQNPVYSAAGSPSKADAQYRYGQLISDSKGTLLVHTFRDENNVACTELLEFDKKCGLVSMKMPIYPQITQFAQEMAFAAFSPSERFLYVTWNYSGQTNNIRVNQYDLTETNPNATSVTVGMITRAVADIRKAPDGRLYITSSYQSNACAILDVILDPDVKGSACNLSNAYVNLAPGTTPPDYFAEFFPSFITDVSKPAPGFDKPLPTVKNFCQGDSTEFTVSGNWQADSSYWDFGNGSRSYSANVKHLYPSEGNFDACFNWFLCGIRYKHCLPVKIGKKPVLSLGNDTIFCPGTEHNLFAGPADFYKWSTGDTTAFIKVKHPGKYSVESSKGACTVKDEVEIKYHPGIWTLLGSEYFICEREKELVKLDAGKDFDHYKWYPTGDTTQWIIVGTLGKYFVIVKDFRGCKGEDSTNVLQRCPVRIYFPSAFTPNGDTKNDVFLPTGSGIETFSIQIFNRWGEKIFESNQLDKGWDGTLEGVPSSEGVYYYSCIYSGFQNKKLKTFQVSGDLTLIR